MSDHGLAEHAHSQLLSKDPRSQNADIWPKWRRRTPATAVLF